MNEPPENFFVKQIRLEKVEINYQTVSLSYLLDGDAVTRTLTYNSIDFDQSPFTDDKQALKCFAVSIGVIHILRFGTVLPAVFDVKKYSGWIHEDLLKYIHTVCTPSWSEHRYQVGRMDYRGPKIEVDPNQLGTWAQTPIWRLASGPNPKVIVASGSGKDSVLCAKLIERANISYDQITYIDSLYGEPHEQGRIFSSVSEELHYENQHFVTISDDYYPWLEKRLEHYQMRENVQNLENVKPFRVEAGETLTCSLIFAPIQYRHQLPIAILGHEKSADAHNLVDPASGEKVAHQWTKCIDAEKAVQALQRSLFENMLCVSIIKPFYDVKIFKTLFELVAEMPYLTHSCNIEKPWCRQCPKCAYVFSGFVAFGDYDKTVAAFTEDLFQKESLLPLWSELLGLQGYIPWECVGLHEEVQIYFYQAFKKGIEGPAIDLFEQKILTPLKEKGVELETHFVNLETTYSQVDQNHHNIPDWLWQKLQLAA